MDSEEISREKSPKTGVVRGVRLFFDRLSGGYTENPVVIWLFLVGAAINAANWGALSFFIKPVSENIILHYNVYFGVDLTGSHREAYFLPAAGLFILLFNFFLGAFFFKNRERVASYIFLMTALMANLSLFIAGLSIVIINY